MSTEPNEQTEPLGQVNQPQTPQVLPLSAPVPLTQAHDISEFDCGNQVINDYLKQAPSNQKRLNAAVYVACLEGTEKVKAFFTLTSGSIVRSELPKKITSQSPNVCPITILGRLGVDKDFTGLGIGTDLVREAYVKSKVASTIVASKGLVVHAKSEDLVDYYIRCGFIRTPLSDLTLILPF